MNLLVLQNDLWPRRRWWIAGFVKLYRWLRPYVDVHIRAHLLSTTIAGSRLTGVTGARQLEIREILVTLAALLLSLSYGRALRDATLLAGWAALVLGLGTARERSREALVG